MDFCKLLVYFFLLNCPIEGKIKVSGIPMEFLERFAAAHDGHATVVITEKDSGTSNLLVFLIFAELLSKPMSALFLKNESKRLNRLAVIIYQTLLW